MGDERGRGAAGGDVDEEDDKDVRKAGLGLAAIRRRRIGMELPPSTKNRSKKTP